MTFTRRSPWTNKLNIMDINVTGEQTLQWLNGTPIDVAMPNISAEEKEFILTGITKEDAISRAKWFRENES